MKKKPYNIIDPEIQEYTELHTSSESSILKDLNRYTNVNVLYPRMLSGQVLGKFLSFMSQMIQPDRILEIGTYTGYSAICLAAGLKEGGRLDTIEVNPELKHIINRYIHKSGFEQRINLYIGDALDIIPELDGAYDLVFIDADKISYPDYYKLIFPKVKKGGIIMADNALWDGKVLDPNDKETEALAAFNDMVQNDERVENILLPLRDGVMMIRII